MLAAPAKSIDRELLLPPQRYLECPRVLEVIRDGRAHVSQKTLEFFVAGAGNQLLIPGVYHFLVKLHLVIGVVQVK